MPNVETMVSYIRKPRTSYIFKHPLKAMKAARVRSDLRDAFNPKRVAIGLGAAALAVPLGLWIGRKFGPTEEEVMASSAMA